MMNWWALLEHATLMVVLRCRRVVIECNGSHAAEQLGDAIADRVCGHRVVVGSGGVCATLHLILALAGVDGGLRVVVAPER